MRSALVTGAVDAGSLDAMGIREITAVALDRPPLLAAHFISDTNATILADSARGDLEGEDVVEVLRRRLPG
jgi:hypothetical protein